ncbi:MAG: PAS domain-containing protein, partial [Alphaproteobacteria bacterium]|nr:PAS domain-containing protein [Alphaproteobacteria bacterium]
MISLKTCADLLADAPNCLAFLTAWQRWRGDDPVPSVDRIKPEELGKALNGLSILEVHSPECSKYRLVGASHIQAMGRDLTGEEVASVTPKNDQAQRMQGLWTMVSVPCGAIAELSYVRQSGFRTPTRRLVLPATPKSSGGTQRLYVAGDISGGRAMRDYPPAGPVGVAGEGTYRGNGRGGTG